MDLQWRPKVDNPPSKRANKRKTKGGKSAAKRGPTAMPPSRGTGFEEYFADPPMTPQEAQIEQNEVYSDDLSFEERIHSCIKRYRARRRLQGSLIYYFDEYLFLGGIDASPAPFSGQDPRDRIETTADTVGAPEDRFYNGDREKWSVDFSGVASGFFSTTIGPLTGFDPEAVDVAIGVVENFLRYVLHHDVCPEHSHDVKCALRICADAREEWPMLLRMQAALPGQFNLVAARLSGVHDESDWAFHGQDPAGPSETGVRQLRLWFLASLALMDEPAAFDAMINNAGGPKVAKQFECSVEVTKIERPAFEIGRRFKSFKSEDLKVQLSPIGKVRVKPASIEDGWDHPPGIRALNRSMMLFFDDDILINMKPGMKLSLEICKLESGLHFVKRLLAAVPTFYTFLPQELMRHFKSPRENNRPAPSVHDANAGDLEEQDEARN